MIAHSYPLKGPKILKKLPVLTQLHTVAIQHASNCNFFFLISAGIIESELSKRIEDIYIYKTLNLYSNTTEWTQLFFTINIKFNITNT